MTETHLKSKYYFTEDWFCADRHARVFSKYLNVYKGKPDINYLEIGTWEGKSVIWMLENILTHPSSQAACIDVYDDQEAKARLFKNLKLSGFENKTNVVVGKSQDKLLSFSPESYDIIYIDGSHYAKDVLSDAVLSWPLLKKNGLLIFDDYGDEFGIQGHDLPIELTPKYAIDSFITCYREYMDELYRDYMLVLKKLAFPYNPNKHFGFARSYIGEYMYDWPEQELSSCRTAEKITLNDKEKDIFRRLLHSRGFGEIKFTVKKDVFNSDGFQKLLCRLKIDLDLFKVLS